MKGKSIYGYYVFGYNYSVLQDKGPKSKRSSVVVLLGNLIKKFDELGLIVTQQAASKLIILAKNLGDSSDELVGDESWGPIKAELNKIDSTLDAELKLRKAYVLTEKRFDIDKLLNKPESLLGLDLFRQLSPATAKDYALACRQIALSQSTAAAFHLMRMLESEVKVLYFSFKRTKRLDKPMWGPMTQQLRQKKRPKPSDKLLDHLDGMRVHFRNPTQHPDKFYDIEEAQDLLSQTIAAVRMIRSEIPNNRA